jgi:hypothetical protein
LRVRRIEVSVDARLEIGEARVGALEQVADTEELAFAEDGQGSSEQAVPDEGQRDLAGQGFVHA